MDQVFLQVPEDVLDRLFRAPWSFSEGVSLAGVRTHQVIQPDACVLLKSLDDGATVPKPDAIKIDFLIRGHRGPPGRPQCFVALPENGAHKKSLFNSENMTQDIAHIATARAHKDVQGFVPEGDERGDRMASWHLPEREKIPQGEHAPPRSLLIQLYARESRLQASRRLAHKVAFSGAFSSACYDDEWNFTCKNAVSSKKITLVYSAQYEADIGTHIFRTRKFRGIWEALRRLAPDAFTVVEPPPYTREEFREFFTEEYEEDLFGARESLATLRSELPVTPEIIHWQLVSAMGTYLASRLALRENVAGHIGGGLHHGCRDHAEGFCYVNDLAYAMWRLLREGAIRTALVIDCDLHQGNGTAEYFRGDPRVFTFSIHDEWNYPMPKSVSSLDIGLPPNTTGAEYLYRLRGALEKIFHEFRADIALYQAGVDPYERDQLGNLRLTADDLKERDRLVLTALHSHEIPTVITLGGGYPPTLEELVALHTETFLIARDIWTASSSHQ